MKLRHLDTEGEKKGVLKKWMQNRQFGLKMEEEWSKLHNRGLKEMCSLLNTSKMVTQTLESWVYMHIKKINAHTI